MLWMEPDVCRSLQAKLLVSHADVIIGGMLGCDFLMHHVAEPYVFLFRLNAVPGRVDGIGGDSADDVGLEPSYISLLFYSGEILP